MQDALYDAAISFGQAIKRGLTESIGKGRDASGRNKKSSYRSEAHEVAGAINISLWHAIGHPVSFLASQKHQNHL